MKRSAPRTRGARWRSAVGAVVLACSVALVAQPLTAAAAPAIPSAKDVQAAERAAAVKRQSVIAIQGQLAAASAELDRLQIAAQLAGQAYNAAVEKLAAAKVAAAKAAAADKAAQAEVVVARKHVGTLARSQVQGSGPLVDIASMLSSDGPQQLIDRIDTFSTVSAVMQGNVVTLRAAERKAAAASARARSTQATVQKATDLAEEMRKQAAAAATAQQNAVDSYAARRTLLITELAQAQRVSVAVARQRQEGLERLARERAEAKRQAEARAQAAREAAERRREEAAAADQRRQEALRQEARRQEARRQEARRQETAERREQQRRDDRNNDDSNDDSSNGDDSNGDDSNGDDSNGGGSPKSDPAPVVSPVNNGGNGSYDAAASQRAIAFAKAQLGEPYVFGAVGPGTWDCSGLTMRAWESQGKSIGHFTGTQWGNVRHISQDQLRPGDLLFWGDPSNPSSIYHTAMYLGDGMMIQAPRPGKGVEIISMYYWVAPNIFGRVW